MLRDVEQILLLLAQVFALQLREQRRQLLGGLVHRPFGVDLLAADELLDLADKGRVLEQQAVGVEDPRELGPELGTGTMAHVVDVGARRLERFVETPELGVEILVADREAEHLEAS